MGKSQRALKERLRALSRQRLVLDAVSSLVCLICVRQRPCARKGAISQCLRTKITPLDANSIKTRFGATSGEPPSGSRIHLCFIADAKKSVRTYPTCVASPTKQNKNLIFSPKYYRNRSWSKSSQTQGVVQYTAVIVLPAFALLRHQGATEFRPEPKRVRPWPNPKLDWR